MTEQNANTYDPFPSTPIIESPDDLGGRAFKPIPVGTPVLAVICPGLVWRLLMEEFPEGKEGADIVNELQVGIMEAVQANPQLGVLRAKVEEVGRGSEIGLYELRVAPIEGPAALFLDTETRLTAALSGLVAPTGEPSSAIRERACEDAALDQILPLMGIDAAAFERAHPWITRAGLRGGERREIMRQLSERGLFESMREIMESEEAIQMLVERIPGLKEPFETAVNAGDGILVGKLVMAALRMFFLKRPCERLQLVFADTPENRERITKTFDQLVNDVAYPLQLAREWATF